MKFNWILIISLFLLLCCSIIIESICPEKCSCKKISEDRNELRVKCGTPQNKIQSFKELIFGDDIENVVHLDLSKNQISFIEKIDFTNYTNLKRLNLSYNSFKQIDESMFGEIPTLERLDLSTNVIVHIHQGSFEKLSGLKQLDISNNPLACDCDLLWLVTWSNNFSVKLRPPPKCETPKPFKGYALRKLRVGLDLHCESPLQPLLELKPDTDQLVFEGDTLVLRCRAPRVAVGPPNDSEDLPARAHLFWGWSEKIIDQNSTEDIIYRDPTVHFPSIQIDAKHLSDSGLLDSILKIPYVTRNHTGMWDCRLRSQQANLSHSINLLVISDKTKYCPAIDLHNNKGKYFWPRTVRGRTVRLPCAGEQYLSSSTSQISTVATYTCNNNGEWENLNTVLCPFISETTRVLEQFSKVNLSIAKGSVLESAKRLRNFTQSEDIIYKIRDPIDLVFISRTLKNYLTFVSQEKDLGTMLLDIVSQISILSRNLSFEAYKIDPTTTQLIIDSVEQAVQYTPLSLTHKPHLAIELFKIRLDSFNGLTCAWFYPTIAAATTTATTSSPAIVSSDSTKSTETTTTNSAKIPITRTFQCNTASQTIDIFKNHIDASIQIPQNFLPQQHQLQFIEKLMISVYENGNFFPNFQNESHLHNNFITSAVIGVKLSLSSTTTTTTTTNSPIHNLNERNLSEPISIMLRARPFHNDHSFPIPIYWDMKTKSWSKDNCQFSYYFHGLVVFTCNRLGYYGLMQNSKYLNDFLDENSGAKFRLSPIGFYIGSIILFICIWINIVTYLIYGQNSIHMARRQRHSLINTWLALSILVLIFCIGIFQTEDHRICQIIGICIHYFSLCVLLWICVNVSAMYKRLSKRSRLPIDDIPKENLGKKPILGIYLVGWGIGLIICGISSAVNIREYASYSYCFLKTGPALSAIFIPSTILLIFILILFICIKCHIRNSSDTQHHHHHHHHHDHFSEGTQATENVDLKLLETVNGTATTQMTTSGHHPHHHHSLNPSHHAHYQRQEQRYRSLTLSSPTTSMFDDLEHTNSAQLKAYFIFLLLYIISWLSAAATIVSPFNEKILYEEEIFSIIYAITTTILGLFLVFFYCLSRSDVRLIWSTMSCRSFCINSYSCCCCRRKRIICDNTKELNTVTYHHQACGSANGEQINSAAGSRSTSQCSKTRTPSTTNYLKSHTNANVAAELNSQMIGIGAVGTLPLTRNESPNKILTSPSNIVLVNPVILTQEIPNPEIFYNPNQINVARKFFKKQKRLAKRNNFELQRHLERSCGVGGDYGVNDAASDISSIASYPKTVTTTSTSRGGGMSSSIFNGGSKVNNTNIHVKNSYLDDIGGGGRHFLKDSIKQHNYNSNILSSSSSAAATTDNYYNDNDDLILAAAAEGLRALSSAATSSAATTVARANKINNTEMVANIYTNVPETTRPQHETVTMRADDKFLCNRKSMNVDDLLEQDEIDMIMKIERNDLNQSQTVDRTNTPLYINDNIRRNIMMNDYNQQQQHNCLNDEKPALELKAFDNDNSNVDQLILSLNSPIAAAAMNTIGLPSITSTATTTAAIATETSVTPISTTGTTISVTNKTNSVSDSENLLDLHKNEAYVSKPLEITDRVYENDYEPSIRINYQQQQQLLQQQQQKSKSLENFDFEQIIMVNKKKKQIEFSFCEEQSRSVSCSNLSQIDIKILGNVGVHGINNNSIDDGNKKNPPLLPSTTIDSDGAAADKTFSDETPSLSSRHLDSSPVLFSPSLCEIDDLPSPADRRKPLILNDDDDVDDMIGIGMSGDCSNGGGLFSENSDSILTQSLRYNFTSSPTCESDLNYQNSELSIRSHGVYAPQPDNDLNITLTGDEQMFYPYQPSELSDDNDNVDDFGNDDDDEDDGFNNCSNDCLLGTSQIGNDGNCENDIGNNDLHGSQSSIDELYQRIKIRNHSRHNHHRHQQQQQHQRSGGAGDDGGNDHHDSSGELIDESNSMISDRSTNIQKNLEITNMNENDDDSSQCSIISYIDPNECSKTDNCS